MSEIDIYGSFTGKKIKSFQHKIIDGFIHYYTMILEDDTKLEWNYYTHEGYTDIARLKNDL